jgi:hypothetical protein
MKAIEVKTSREIREFLMLPVRLYKNQPHWIQPLNKILNGFLIQKKINSFIMANASGGYWLTIAVKPLAV